MPGFLNILRGAADTASGIRSGHQQAEMQTLPLLVQLQQMAAQREQAQRAFDLQQRLGNAQIKNYESEAYAREHPADQFDTVPAEEGIFSRSKRTGQLAPLNSPTTGKPLHVHQTPPNNVYLPSQQPNGETTYTVVPNKGAVNPENTGIVKPPASGSSGSQAPVGDMEARLQEIELHAKNLAAHKTKISRAMQIREGLGYGIANQSAEGKGVPLSQAGAAMGMDLFGLGEGKDYEQFQALMNSTRAFGDDAAKVFKGRQNEQAVAREIALSQLSPDDYQNPQVVEQKLSRMRHVLELARETMPAAGNAAPTTHPAPHAAEPSGAAPSWSKYGVTPSVP